MRRSGPLRRGGIAGQGGEEDGPQRTPCAGGRAAGRLDDGFRAAKGRRGGLEGGRSGTQSYTGSARSRPFCLAAITERDAQECDTSDSKIQLAPRHWIIWIRGTPSGRLFSSAWRMG